MSKISLRKIPKILHLIWIGNNPQPKTLTSWTVDFANHYPDWTVKVWNNQDVENLKMVNKKYYDIMPQMCAKADLARYEILYKYGGIYIDADTIWLGKSLNDELFKGSLNMSYEKENLIMNTWFSTVKKHPFFKKVINEVKYRDIEEEAWLSVGPSLVTEVFNSLSKRSHNSYNINFIDSSKILCPSNWGGITENNYNKILNKCKKKYVFAFHWGLSSNHFNITCKKSKNLK